jgi:hypothetical protein
MLDTVNTKPSHYTDGCFRTGTGENVVVILGSCRIFPYVNYFNRWNEGRNEFTIVVINIVNFAFDQHDNHVNSDHFTVQFETNPVLLGMLKRCRIFIHEHAENFGMFNTCDKARKNIYQFGLNPEMDIAVPNFHDRFVLENDWRSCGMEPPEDYLEKGESAIHQFTNQTILTSFPEFGDLFKDTWRDIRYFWTPNHVSSHFSILVFTLMNERFLRMPLTEEFWNGARQEDLFKTPCTEVTQRDRDGYRITW